MMSTKGMDAAVSMAALGAQLVSDGYGFVVRYLFNASKFKVRLSRPEAVALSKAGLSVVTVWESGFPTQASYFTAAQGHNDAYAAWTQALAAGQPIGTVIYFAVDGDVDPSSVVSYFETVKALLRGVGGQYTPAVYGSGAVCEKLSQMGLVSHTWLSQSRGWEGFTEEETKANMVQGKETMYHGRDVDLDVSGGDGGGWKVLMA